MPGAGAVGDAVLVLYGAATLLLGATGLYYGLLAAERVVRTRSRDTGPGDLDTYPDVTVQIPVYNERHVVVTAFGQAPRWLLVVGVLGTTPGPLAYLALGQTTVDRPGTVGRLLATVPLTLLGVGIAWRMTEAVLSGFVEMGGVFERTPKFGVEGPRRSWDDVRYDRPLETTAPEVLLAGWCAVGAVLAVATGAPRMGPSVAVFALAFGTVALAIRSPDRL